MIRKPIFAANWKMNIGPSETEDFAKSFLSKIQNRTFPCDIVIAPPFVSLAKATEILGNVSSIALAAQNCSQFDSGAYTGEISAMMLKEFFVHYVILGHSERRADHGETDAGVRAKAVSAAAAGLLPVVCVGETEAQRLAGEAEKVVSRQLAESLPDGFAGIVAYEPVWAIGTGRTPTEADIAAIHGTIRAALAARFSDVGAKTRILYGGSMKPSNAKAILALPDVDGGLVGGASLVAADFLAIAKAAGC